MMIQKLHYTFPRFGYSLLCLFLALPALAQDDYQWQWALKGGGSEGGISGTGPWDEQIYDVKVGTDNNYYFIATIEAKLGANLKGEAVETNNIYLGGNDIFLFSTTCEGEVRWSQAIGGGSSDNAYNLVLDSDNNVYIGGYFNSAVTNAAGTYPVRFSPTDSLPAQDYWNRLFLAKYSSDGDFLGKKALQGEVDLLNSGSQILDLVMDKQDRIHLIVALLNGTHLDSQVIVPEYYRYDEVARVYTIQYHLAKYDSNLNYISSMVLPISEDSSFSAATTRFAYDEPHNQYYIAGMRSPNVTGIISPLTYQGNAFVERSFILAIDGSNGNEHWRREIYSELLNGTNIPMNSITSLVLDEDFNVYIGGMLWRNYLDPIIKIYDPTNANITPHYIDTELYTNFPFLAKLAPNGTVQWSKVPTDFAENFSGSNTYLKTKGMAINENEVALGSGESYFIWDGFTQNNPQYYKPDPTLLRFDKQTGTTVGMDVIPGYSEINQFLTAVATDRDGNYITGGTFVANLFWDNPWGIEPIISTGNADFFAAKLAKSPCGSGSLSTENSTPLTLNLYPNPTTGIVHIDSKEDLFSYTVYDIQGRQIQQNLFNNQKQVQLENTQNGVYFIKITTTQGSSSTLKVVVKN